MIEVVIMMPFWTGLNIDFWPIFMFLNNSITDRRNTILDLNFVPLSLFANLNLTFGVHAVKVNYFEITSMNVIVQNFSFSSA